MFLTSEHLRQLESALAELRVAADVLPPHLAPSITAGQHQILNELAVKLRDNAPFGHPFYLGQMLKPPHPLAHLAYTLAMNVNPNNHARDGGPVTSDMEVECISQLAAMYGWREHLGHLTGGGTLANFEALWVARELTGSKLVLASEHAHYTHERLSQVLKVPFLKVRVDVAGRMDLDHLREILRTHEVGTVVATAGTTGLGAVDPIQQIVELRQEFPFRLHVDAAYGGYFMLAANLRLETREAFDAITKADSIVIDPHKHGLQPYGCGCILFRDRSVAAIYRHESPYTYFTPADLHLGEISLECSRPGSAAAALWATMRALPLQPGGEFAKGLEQGRSAALQLREWIEKSDTLTCVTDPELDIVVWTVRADRASDATRAARQFFEAAAQRQIHLALITLPRPFLNARGAVQHWDQDEITCLRSCLMKPDHLEWMPEILTRLQLVSEDFDWPNH